MILEWRKFGHTAKICPLKFNDVEIRLYIYVFDFGGRKFGHTAYKMSFKVNDVEIGLQRKWFIRIKIAKYKCGRLEIHSD